MFDYDYDATLTLNTLVHIDENNHKNCVIIFGNLFNYDMLVLVLIVN